MKCGVPPGFRTWCASASAAAGSGMVHRLQPVAYDWAARRPAPTLLLAADPAIGLTRELVDVALAWAGDPGR